MKTFQFFSFILILFLFTGSSCEEKIIDQDFALGREYAFEINKLYTSNDGHYSLIINEVSDSRCPTGVQCIWQGEVTVKGELSENGSKYSFEIHSVLTQLNKVPGTFSIKFVDAKPYPRSDGNSDPENLIITLLIDKYITLDKN